MATVIQEHQSDLFMVCLGPRRGGSPLSRLYRYVQRQRVLCFSRFGLKWNINFDHFGSRLREGRLYINFRSAVFKTPLEPGAWPERVKNCCGTYTVIKKGNSLTMKKFRPPKVQRLVVAHGRRSFTRIKPQGVSFTKRSRHIFSMEDNLLHAMSKLGYV